MNNINESRTRRQFSFQVTTLVGSSVCNFIRICKGMRFQSRYTLRLVLSFIVALIFELPSLFEKAIWTGRLKKIKINEPPVFIIGFWRSGTTMLHNVLCLDPKAAYVTTFHAVFPNLVLSQTWLKKLTNLILPANRPFDNVPWDMDSPQEEEFALFNMQPVSFYKFFLFPEQYDEIYEHHFSFKNYPENVISNWKKQYQMLMRKAMINTHGVRYIGKNPCNLPKVRLLKEMFPDAKFIYISRNPYKVVESLYQFFHSIIPGIQLQESSGLPDRQRIAKLYADAADEYLLIKSIIPPANLAEIRYEDLLKDLPGTIRQIYADMGFEGYNEVLPHLRSYLDTIDKCNLKIVEVPDETKAIVNQVARSSIEKLGYPVESPHSFSVA